MPIDASIISQAQNIPQIRYQPESQFESFAKIQPTLNAMQQMRTQTIEAQEKMARIQGLQKAQQDLIAAGKSGDMGMYADALLTSPDATHRQLGAQIKKTILEAQAEQQALAPFRGQPVTRESVQNMMLAGGPAGRVASGLERTLPAEPQPQSRYQVVGGSLFDKETKQFMAPPAQPAATGSQERRYISTPQGVFDTQTRQLVEGTQKPVAPPAAPTALTEAQLIKRRDTIAEEYKSASNALQVTQDVLDSATQVKESEGLSRATGFTGTMLPSFPGGQAAFAETRLKNLKGKVTALGKAAAASTGSIGQIANQEWKILADQIAAIEEIKGAEPLLEQIGLLEAQAQGAMRRIKDAYQKQFGEDFERFPQFSTLLEPKSVLKRAPQGRGPAPVESAPSAGNTVTLPDGRVMNFPNAAAAAAFKKAAGL
jgi:hypothetical protein